MFSSYFQLLVLHPKIWGQRFQLEVLSTFLLSKILLIYVLLHTFSKETHCLLEQCIRQQLAFSVLHFWCIFWELIMFERHYFQCVCKPDYNNKILRKHRT